MVKHPAIDIPAKHAKTPKNGSIITGCIKLPKTLNEANMVKTHMIATPIIYGATDNQ